MREFFSTVFNERLALLTDNEQYTGPLTPYTKSEMAMLYGMKMDDMKRVHEIKKMFGGKIIGRRP